MHAWMEQWVDEMMEEPAARDEPSLNGTPSTDFNASELLPCEDLKNLDNESLQLLCWWKS